MPESRYLMFMLSKQEREQLAREIENSPLRVWVIRDMTYGDAPVAYAWTGYVNRVMDGLQVLNDPTLRS